MIGSISGNPVFPVSLEENVFQCDSNALTQLQLFGNFIAGIDVNPGNYAGNDHIPALSWPSKRSRGVEDSSRQQNLQISFHNYCQEGTDQLITFPNPNDVSTGLRLSYDDDERNSSVTSASGSMPPLHMMMSLSDNVRNEIDRQKSWTITSGFRPLPREEMLKKDVGTVKLTMQPLRTTPIYYSVAFHKHQVLESKD